MIDMLDIDLIPIDKNGLVYLGVDHKKRTFPVVEAIINQYDYSIPSKEGHDNVSPNPPLDNRYFFIYDAYAHTLLSAAFFSGKINYHLFHKLCSNKIGMYIEDKSRYETSKLFFEDISIFPFDKFYPTDDFIVELLDNQIKEFKNTWESIMPHAPYYFNKHKFEYDKQIEYDRMREQQFSRNFGARLPR